ncbi:MAG TPA: glucose 1-dehydrogenase [Pseudomonadales bacterium]|jgi:cyclopentanol dehydrogenase|nr:glucose 1-dehydrogenase [Gammaproteobacteria bacterium]HIL84373.1 glucose 1-dehydrogenase [Pseudomonadales bacterium]
MNRVEGKVALVTGGAMGMGMTHSQLLAEEGAKVIVTDVNEVEGQKVADEINASGGTATFYPLDVTDESQWQAVVASVIGSEGKIDVLVNNAGLLILKPVDETTNEEWDLIFNINAKGPFLGTKAVLPAMQKAGGGSIINISSIYGLVGAPQAAAYQSTKGALRLLTKSSAVDLAQYNIRVNSVHPGVIDTAMTKDLLADEESRQAILGTTILGRPAQPKEVSYAVLFLASDESSFMTGSEMVVDGGYTAM